jgi:hypothetical protein
MDPMPENDAPLPPQIAFLKRLVTVLSVVMIAGFLDPLPLPERITLPDGAAARAFTQGDDWFAVVTSDNEILIYDRATSQLQQRVQIGAE